MAVTPSNGLSDGQKVQVELSGFPAGKKVVVRQCGDANATLPGQCNPATKVTVTVDAHGTATSSFTVKMGPFGTAKGICTPGQEPACAIEAIEQGGALHAAPVNVEFAGETVTAG
jgi:hypothetical protein